MDVKTKAMAAVRDQTDVAREAGGRLVSCVQERERRERRGGEGEALM